MYTNIINCYSKIKDILPDSYGFVKTEKVVLAVKQYINSITPVTINVKTGDLNNLQIANADFSDQNVIVVTYTNNNQKIADIIINKNSDAVQQRFGIICALNLLLNLNAEDYRTPEYYSNIDLNPNNKQFAFDVLIPNKYFLLTLYNEDSLSRTAAVYGIDRQYIIEKIATFMKN